MTPDFRTIADFRKNNAKALKQVFKAFVKVCIDLQLYERELIAIDGSKFRAVNGRKKMYNEAILKKKLTRIEENITNYLTELDQGDQSDMGATRYNTTAGRVLSSVKRHIMPICENCNTQHINAQLPRIKRLSS